MHLALKAVYKCSHISYLHRAELSLIQSLSMSNFFLRNIWTRLATMQRQQYIHKCSRSAPGYGVIALHMCCNPRRSAGKVGSKVRQPWGHHGPNHFCVVVPYLSSSLLFHFILSSLSIIEMWNIVTVLPVCLFFFIRHEIKNPTLQLLVSIALDLKKEGEKKRKWTKLASHESLTGSLFCLMNVINA